MASLEELLAVAEAIPVELRSRPLPGQTWSPRDVLAHIAAWQEAGLDRLNGSGPKIDGDAETDAWNAAASERWSGVEWTDVITRLRESRDLLFERAGSPTPPWVPDWSEVHYDDHLADLRSAAAAG